MPAKIGYSGTPGSSTFDPFKPQPPAGTAPAAPAPLPVPPATSSTPPQKATEPAVLSSSNIDDLNKTNAAKVATMAQKGATIDPTSGVTVYADNSAVPAPQGAVYNDKTGQYEAADGKTYSVAEFYGQNGGTPDADYTAVQNMFAPLKATLDANTLASVNTIQQQFDALKAKQTEYNQRAEQARSRSLLLGGASRYAPLDASGTMLAQTSYGLQQIQDLDAKENAAIAQAKQAQEDGNMKLLDDALGIAEGVRKDKQAAAQKVMTDLQTANEKLTTQRLQLAQGDAVAKLMAAGTTDPAQILKNMQDAGYTVTADDIAKMVKDLTPADNASDTYKFSTASVGKLLSAGLTSPQIQALSDFYNGNGHELALSSLTTDQQAAVHDILNGNPTGDDKILTPAQAKALGVPYGTTAGEAYGKTPVSTSPASKTYTSGSMTYTSPTLGKIQSWVTATKGSDGYVDPNAYKQAFDAWIKDGGLAKDFLKNFPPKSYINPTNDWLPQYLSSHTGKASADISQSIQDLFPTP